jgi:hypothetical protein
MAAAGYRNPAIQSAMEPVLDIRTASFDIRFTQHPERAIRSVAVPKHSRPLMKSDIATTSREENKKLVLKAFDLFNKRDYVAAEQLWATYIQHSAHIPAAGDGWFKLVRPLPDTLRCENHVILAEGQDADQG